MDWLMHHASSRYLHLLEELIILGAEPSQCDKGIFFFKGNEMILHADYIMRSGIDEDQAINR